MLGLYGILEYKLWNCVAAGHGRYAWIVFYVEGCDVSSVECNTIYRRIWHLYDLDSFATFYLGHYLYYIKLCALPYTNQVVLRMSYCMYWVFFTLTIGYGILIDFPQYHAAAKCTVTLAHNTLFKTMHIFPPTTLLNVVRPVSVWSTTRTSSSVAATQPSPIPSTLECSTDGKKLKVSDHKHFFLPLRDYVVKKIPAWLG